MNLKDEVAKAAAVLDAEHPGWHEKINLASLNLGSCTNCILGQLDGHFMKAPIRLQRLRGLVGYRSPYNAYRQKAWSRFWFVLNQLWTDLIANLRSS